MSALNLLTKICRSFNEQLQSDNEEMQTANEELQSTNEELQSVNVELQTINKEHQITNTELSESNDDLNNYLNLLHRADIVKSESKLSERIRISYCLCGIMVSASTQNASTLFSKCIND